MTTPSSPETMSQFLISTLREWSGSMPSQLGTSRRLRTLTLSTRTWSQPSMCRPQLGASAKVMSRTSRSLALGEDEHLGAKVFGDPPLVDFVVAEHELAGAALQCAGTGDA